MTNTAWSFVVTFSLAAVVFSRLQEQDAKRIQKVKKHWQVKRVANRELLDSPNEQLHND